MSCCFSFVWVLFSIVCNQFKFIFINSRQLNISIHSNVQVFRRLLHLYIPMEIAMSIWVCILYNLVISEPVLGAYFKCIFIRNLNSRFVLFNPPKALMKHNVIDHLVNKWILWIQSPKQIINFMKLWVVMFIRCRVQYSFFLVSLPIWFWTDFNTWRFDQFNCLINIWSDESHWLEDLKCESSTKKRMRPIRSVKSLCFSNVMEQSCPE